MITGMPRIAIAAANFDDLVDTFRNKLGIPVVDLSQETVPELGAKVAMCVPKGGSNIELMGPGLASAPLSQSLQRFLDRRGAGLFALMLEAPDPDAEAETLASRGLNVLPLMPGAGGRDIHPNATHGVLIRVYPVDSYRRDVPAGVSAGALSGVQRVIIAVKDLTAAASVYGAGLGLPTSAPAVDAERGVEHLLVHPPTGGKIELVAVRDRTRPFAAAIGAHLDSNPQGMYALVLRTADPLAMLEPLRAKGLEARISADSPEVIEIDRGSLFGALVRVEAG